MKNLKHVYYGFLNQNKFYIQKRYMAKKRNNVITNIDKAVEYYDTVYKPVYGKKWEKMKRALFADAKYAALINNFSDNEKILNEFEELGAYDVGAFYTKNISTLDQSTNELQEGSVSNLSSTEEEVSKPNKIRPSLIKLTEDEKAAALKDAEIDHYPKEYRMRVMEKSKGISDFDIETSRVIKASQMSMDQMSLKFDHVPATKLKSREEISEEIDPFSKVSNIDHDFGVKRKTESEPIKWPENLKLFSFVKGDKVSEFPSPKPSENLSVFTHYLFNGASILPVLALDIQFGDRVLDMCSSPGGKSLSILQTLMPELLVCNDVSESRIGRIEKVFEQYLPKNLSIWNSINFSLNSGTIVGSPDSFDKVLVDAPCFNDRLSLHESDNSIFKHTRLKERHLLPELQAQLIFSALKHAKPGGCVVYSTCTLSPLQNDGAVHLALSRVWRETKIDCTVVNMAQTMKNLRFMYNTGDALQLRYGHVVIPLLDNNCGPMYICKIIRER